MGNKILKITIPTSRFIVYRIPREAAINGKLPEEIKNLAVVYVARNQTELYTGESDICEGRLGNINSHGALNKNGFFWNELIIFTSEEFSKDVVRFLEGELIKKAKSGKYKVLNNQSSGANINDQSRKLMIKQYLNMILELDDVFLKTKCFFSVEEKIEKIEKEKEIVKQESELYQKMSIDRTIKRYGEMVGVKATLFRMEDGKVILKRGSKIVGKDTNNFLGSPYYKLRNELIENGDIDENFIITRNLEFETASPALSIVFATHAGEKAFERYINYEGNNVNNE